ncbi:ArsI/CadI family heavy metal resistance metalloenzyme [Candidatus Palauibacter sp.]|uniref:ArsI/CadI family heavy metal resistance metalloenzyme n=1 Tax=Candidatus Palauibacter sp. TaxID=3101350 RepID=UPI003B01A0AB
MRLQLALNVRDIDEAVDYYGKLFGATPHKRRPGYANFAIDAPPLKLVLFEKPDAEERLNHLGVEVFDGALVRQAGDRLEAADILTEVEEETVCCHATQTKVWSHEPQGLRWEWYVVTDDAPDGRVLIDPAPAACATDSEDCCA